MTATIEMPKTKRRHTKYKGEEMIAKSKIVAFLSVIIFLSIAQFSYAETRYSFGVVPQQRSSVLKQKWDPIIAHIAETTGIRLEFVRTPDIPSFVDDLMAGEFDFFYANPYSYVQANSAVGYMAFANAKDKKIKGILVVKKDSPYQLLEDMAGKKIIFPEGAFAASDLLRAKFKQMGIEIQTNYSTTHDAGYVAVARGTMDACGGVGRTYNSQIDALKQELRVLWTSDGYTPHALAAHPRVPAEDVRKVQAAIIEMGESPELLELFQAMRINNGFKAAEDSEWDDVREIEPFLKSVSSD